MALQEVMTGQGMHGAQPRRECTASLRRTSFAHGKLQQVLSVKLPEGLSVLASDRTDLDAWLGRARGVAVISVLKTLRVVW